MTIVTFAKKFSKIVFYRGKYFFNLNQVNVVLVLFLPF